MSRTSRLETRSCHLMFRMVSRLCIWKRSSCFRCLLYRVHVSQPEKRLVRTTTLYTLSFVDCLALCWCHQLRWFCKLVDDDLEVRLPMCHEGTVVSKQCFQDSLFTVFVLAVSRRRSNREQSSQYRRYTQCSRSPMACFSTQVKNRLKRTGASTHPCLTPLEMLKGSDASPSESTCPVKASWNWRIRFTNFVGHPSLDRITRKASQLTVSKAFVRSMKTATRSIFCSMHFFCTCSTEKIMPVVLRFARNPHWTSGRLRDVGDEAA